MKFKQSANHLRALSRLFGKDLKALNEHADTNVTITGASVTLLGLVADFCTPLFPMLAYLFPAVVVLAIVLFWRWRSTDSVDVKLQKKRARLSLRSSVALLVLTPVFIFNGIASSDDQSVNRGFLSAQFAKAVSYTHLTLPTNREV